MRLILVAALALLVGAQVSARKKAPATAGTPQAVAPRPMAAAALDSTSAALGTVWGEYLRPDVVHTYGNDTLAIRAYLDGIAAAMTVGVESEPYYRGVHQGIALLRNIRLMRELGVTVDSAQVARAIATYMTGGDTGFTRMSADMYMNDIVAANRPVDTLSVEAERKWLDSQFKRDGVVKYEDGLLFEVIREGEGDYPAPDDKVSLLYTGRLSDGTVFDNTTEPVTFDLVHLVPGFTEGLLHMKAGGKYRIFIPAELAYGPEGIPGAIPGNAALDFTVELLKILPNQE